MTTITHSIDLAVSAATAYHLWTQFERFPDFMEGVESVRRIDDNHLEWVITVGLTSRTFHAIVTERIPGERVAWQSISGVQHDGAVAFERISDRQCRIRAEMSIDPATVTEVVADKAGLIRRRIEDDMMRFKELAEAAP